MNSCKNTQGEFAYGSGHINPVKAINPGLVYEAFKQDYINMLCRMGYDVDKLRTISGDNSTLSRDECFAQLTRAALRQLCRMLLSKPRASRTREESN